MATLALSGRVNSTTHLADPMRVSLLQGSPVEEDHVHGSFAFGALGASSRFPTKWRVSIEARSVGSCWGSGLIVDQW